MTVTLTINGKKVKAKEGSTLLEVTRRMGISIPTLCYHPDLAPHGSCRLCTVEVSKKGRSRLVTACNFPVDKDIEVETHSKRVIAARRTLIELLLARCPKTQVIQDLARELGVKKSRFKTENPENHCILCGLCVRTCHEMVGADAIGFSRRGTQKRIGTPFEIDSDKCIACGACEAICPTGAVKMEMNQVRKMKLSDTGTQRFCRYMRLGLIDFMICSNGFECWRCEVDQSMEDRFGTHPALAIQPAKTKQPFSVNGFTFVPDLYYSEGHVWTKPVDQWIRLGVDEILATLAIEANAIRLPSVGQSIEEREVLAEIFSDGKGATILSPLTGTIMAINRDVEESPNLVWRDPYRRGWLVMIRPDRSKAISKLYSGEKAKTWFTEQAEKIIKQMMKWAPNPLIKKKPIEGDWIREIVRKKWNQLTKILLNP
jgi:glycine cleavage system H lipoate-binding protein/ferredoxin